MTKDGKITPLIDGIPSIGEHHTDRPVVGPDGWIYFGIGSATNSGVVGPDDARFGWLKRFPDFHDIPACDIVLSGQNFISDNALDPCSGNKVVTGAFAPYGTPTCPGQIIKGQMPCNGAILRMPLAGGKPELVAWGFRDPFGLAFSPEGCLYATDNMYDERGSRPVFGAGDLFWKVEPGLWYGFPDYWGNIPLTHRRFAEIKKEPRPQFLLAHHPNVPPEPVARLGVRSSSDGFDFSQPGLRPRRRGVHCGLRRRDRPVQRRGALPGRLPGGAGESVQRSHPGLRDQPGQGGRSCLQGVQRGHRAARGLPLQQLRGRPVRRGLRGDDDILQGATAIPAHRGPVAGAAQL